TPQRHAGLGHHRGLHRARAGCVVDCPRAPPLVRALSLPLSARRPNAEPRPLPAPPHPHAVCSPLPVVVCEGRAAIATRLSHAEWAGQPAAWACGWVETHQPVRCHPGPVSLQALIRRQQGVVTAAQAAAAGMTKGAIRWQVTKGHWRRLYPGVFVTHTGPISWHTRAAAALARAGPGA